MIGVCNSAGKFIGFEVLDASDNLVARFNNQNEQVDHLLPDDDDMPLPPRNYLK